MTIRLEDPGASEQGWAIKYNLTAGESFVLVPSREGASPRFVVPRRFAATALRDGVVVGLTIEVDKHGIPRCGELELRQPEGGEPITSELLRKIPVARFMREALEAVAMELESSPAGISTASLRRQDAPPPKLEHVRGPRRGSPLTEDHLRRVAEVYQAAVEQGDPATQTVANEMHAARSTAARWVAKARERGILGPAKRGQAGEAS